MINIDPNVASAAAIDNIRKNNNKKDKEISYRKKSTKDVAYSESSSNIANVGQMLFLQEIDQHQEEKQDLEDFSKKAFKLLKNLQLELLNGKISERNLHNLNDALNNVSFSIKTPEMIDLTNQIKLRLEVEIAKIEMGKG